MPRKADVRWFVARGAGVGDMISVWIGEPERHEMSPGRVLYFSVPAKSQVVFRFSFGSDLHKALGIGHVNRGECFEITPPAFKRAA